MARQPAARWFTWCKAQRCAARQLAIHWGVPDSSQRDSSAPLPLKQSAQVGAAHSPGAATAMLNGAQPPPRCAPMALSTPTGRAALSTRLLVSGSNSSAVHCNRSAAAAALCNSFNLTPPDYKYFHLTTDISAGHGGTGTNYIGSKPHQHPHTARTS